MKRQFLAFWVICFTSVSLLAGLRVRGVVSSSSGGLSSADESGTALSDTLSENSGRSGSVGASASLGLGLGNRGIPSVSEWTRVAKADGCFAELVVGVKGELSDSLEGLQGMVEGIKGQVNRRILSEGNAGSFSVKIPFSSVSTFIDKLSASGFCRYVEPNWKVKADFVPNDPSWPVQWGPQKIQADFAWNTTVGNRSVLVAVIDTGINYMHSDLAANYVPLGYDWVNNDTDPMDDHGHGTHCAGIIAAAINNLQGIAGLAQVRIMAEKGLDFEGSGYDDDLAQAIVHAVDQGARILSNSWGSDGSSQLIEDAIHYACSRGVLVVAAAGNTGTSRPHYPAAYDDVVAVTATDFEDHFASFTSFGDWVELAAPGVNIYSTYSSGYRSMSGTSMACPHVVGVAALILSQHPNMTETQLRTALRFATDDLGDPGFDVFYGYGRINARKAVEALPLNCGLVLWNSSKPLFLEPDSLGLINATVYNFAMRAIDGVTVQLLANDSLVSEQVIPHLESDSFGGVTLHWIPHSAGSYSLTVWVLPVEGETDLRFHAASGYIHVGIPLRIAALDSSGTAYTEYAKSTWDKLNTEWSEFGDTMIYIEYDSLAKRNITLQEIEATNADALIIASAWMREYTDQEIAAITQYVQQGHGFIITGPTFSSNSVPNNNKFASLFGLSREEYWETTWARDVLTATEPTHPLFNGVSLPFNISDLLISTCVPEDGAWDADELWGGAYVGEGQNHSASIITYRGLVYFSMNLENVGFWDPGVSSENSLQLLYNAMTWSKFQPPQHELIALVSAPEFLLPAETVNITATVQNLGLSDESDVGFHILVNGSSVYSGTIPVLASDSSYVFSRVWSPSFAGFYNVTVSVDPAAGEDNLWNNKVCTWASVMTPPKVLLVADNDEYEDVNGVQRTSLNELKAALDACRAEYYVWEEKAKGSPPLRLLTQVELVVWTVGEAGEVIRVSDIDASKLVTYMKQGGKLFIDADMTADRHQHDTQFLTYVLHCNSIGRFAHPLLLGGTEGLETVVRNHPVTFGLPEEIQWEVLPIVVEGVEPAHGGVRVLDYLDNFEPPPSPEWGILPDKPVISWNAMIVSEDNGHGSTVFCPFPLFALPEAVRTRIVRNSLHWLLPKDHELAVSFTPFKNDFHEQNRQTHININVRNWGLCNETDVAVQLRVNGEVLDNSVVGLLPSGSVYSYSHAWNPTVVGDYNVTVQVAAGEGGDPDDDWFSQTVKVRNLVVLVLSDHHHEMEVVTPVLDSIHVGFHIYYFNKYYGYTANQSFLSDYRAVIWSKSNRKTNQTEHDVISQYVDAGGSLVVTDVPLIYGVTESNWLGFHPITEANVDSLMADILRVSCTGALYLFDPEDHILCPANSSHPILDGLCGTFPVGHNLTGMSPYYENVTAIASRGAVLVANWISPKFGCRARTGYPAHKVVATEVGLGKVVYWGGQGQIEWTQNEECRAVFENLITWFEYGEFHDLKVMADVPALVEPGERVQIGVDVCNLGYYDELAIGVHLAIDGLDVALFPISVVQRRSNVTVAYDWTPSQEKTYNITAYVPVFPEEINATNNVYSYFCDVRVLPYVSVSTLASIDVGEQFSINITIRNSCNVTGWQLEMYYRSYALNVTSIQEGAFLSSVGSTSFQILYANDKYNATHGRLYLACSLTDSHRSVSGSGILVTTAGRSLGGGMCRLTLSNTHLTTVDVEECAHRVESCCVVVGVLGDVDGDADVDILDVVKVTAIYGVRLGNVLYDAHSDINGDGAVTILDLVLCTANYGTS